MSPAKCIRKASSFDSGHVPSARCCFRFTRYCFILADNAVSLRAALGDVGRAFEQSYVDVMPGRRGALAARYVIRPDGRARHRLGERIGGKSRVLLQQLRNRLSRPFRQVRRGYARHGLVSFVAPAPRLARRK